MKKKKIILITAMVFFAFLISLMILFFCYWYLVFFPTNSSTRTLTIANNGGFSIENVTLSCYSGDEHICDYVLEITNYIGLQNVAKYDLPVILNERLELKIDMGRNGILAIDCENASEIYESGVLIYLKYRPSVKIGNSTYTDGYVWFISGKNKTCYSKEALLPREKAEWIVEPNAAKPEWVAKAWMGYVPANNGNENIWVEMQIE